MKSDICVELISSFLSIISINSGNFNEVVKFAVSECRIECEISKLIKGFMRSEILLRPDLTHPCLHLDLICNLDEIIIFSFEKLICVWFAGIEPLFGNAVPTRTTYYGFSKFVFWTLVWDALIFSLWESIVCCQSFTNQMVCLPTT